MGPGGEADTPRARAVHDELESGECKDGTIGDRGGV